MQHDTPPAIPPTAGIDWATDTNELCIIDAAGATVHRRNSPCDTAGIRQLIADLARHNVTRVGIERPDGPVVDALLAARLDVIVITPRQVRHLRARYSAAGNKDGAIEERVGRRFVHFSCGSSSVMGPQHSITRAAAALAV